jgi:hypothetical protein
VQYEFSGEITPEILVVFDQDQNISDFKENNNDISMVYGAMGPASWPVAAKPGREKGKKKGAQRAPLTPTESLWATARSHHHKTHAKYGYLSRAAP